MPNQPTDYTPYLFLAVMIIAGGFVAFVADGLGRKIGKKRLSFFGLRPRYTATLITVGAGVLIPIITILAIYTFSSEVRDWIQKGRGAIQEVKQKTEQVSNLNKELLKIESQRAAQETKVKGLESRAKTLNSKVGDQQKQLATANQKISEAMASVSRLTSNVRTKESALKLSTSSLKDIREKMDILRKQGAQITANLAGMKGNYARVDAQRKEAYAQLDKINKEIAELERAYKDLVEEQKRLQAEISRSKEEITAFQSTIQSQQNEIRENERQLDTLLGNMAEAKRDFETNFAVTRMKPMIFEASEELARIQLPPSLSPAAARTAYFDLLQRARTVAISRKSRNSPLSPPAGLTPREINNRIVSIADQEGAIVRGITAQRPELVFVARSVFNAFEGEYVLLEFVAFRNRLVYPEGKLIVEKRIDGRKSDYEILKQIQDFVETNVRNQALKDGMIPPSGSKGRLGTITEEELFNLISEVRSNDQLVRLQAVAKQDTNAGDQLELLFRVRF